MHRSLRPSLALALLAACSTHAGPSSRPPAPQPLPPVVAPPNRLPAPLAPTSPPRRPAVDLSPRPGRDYYPPCTFARPDICTQIWKRPVPNERDGSRRRPPDRRDDGVVVGPPKPPPDPSSDCFGDQPDCAEFLSGVGAFGRRREMWVGRSARLDFAIAPDDGVLIEELGDPPPEPGAKVNIGRCMRATLETPDSIAVVGSNGEVRRLPDPLAGASWSWSVQPGRSGLFPLRARVEVLESVNGRCTGRVLETYTKLIPVDVRVTVWQRLKGDLGRSKTLGESGAAFLRSWETIGIALLSLLLLGLLIGGLRVFAARRRRLSE